MTVSERLPDVDRREAPSMRTAHWHDDEPFALTWPKGWSVAVLWPATPPPLSRAEIVQALRNPIGMTGLAEVWEGRDRPLLVVDDLSRPTPIADVLDPLLDELESSGIPATRATILLATGTHPAPAGESILRKLGPRAVSTCRVVVHDDRRNNVRIGRTSLGTPIIVDREVADADCVIGIGGIYPNNTAGFGGGPKLALGVLGRTSITHLHEKHRPAQRGRANGGLPLRRDLEEIAAAIGLQTQITVHIDADAKPIRVVAGDHREFYDAEVAWAAAIFKSDPPTAADVVVTNAYPMDATLLAARTKGSAQLGEAPPSASRVLLASCFLGVGGHGLYPLVNRPSTLERLRRKASVMSPAGFARATLSALRNRARPSSPPFDWPILLYRPGSGPKPDLPDVGLQPCGTWEAVIDAIRAQHPGADNLQVVVYPCAPLQVVESVE
jgi:nickel-dependent lactate racemase